MERNIALDLLPTLENVSREFIMFTMMDILYSKEYPNFYFDFKEEEAIKYIEEVLVKNKLEIDKYKKLLVDLKNKNFDNIKPVMVINNYKLFFDLLTNMYKEVINLYFQEKSNTSFGFPVYEMRNYFNNIWLRMLPEDFNNPILFLNKQIDMMKDNTLLKYDRELVLGNLKCFSDNIITIKNNIGNNWDENSKEFLVRIYDKNCFNNDLGIDTHINLPLIRYGIYNRNGKKVCSIGSIQNKELNFDCDIYEYKLNKYINRKKYMLNKNIDKENIDKVEPKNLFVLSLFINVLVNEGIYDIEVPSMYVLDYDYHKKRSKMLMNDFQEKWIPKRRNECPRYYYEDRINFELTYNKEDLISEIKTERLIKTINRLLIHYNINVISYPNELDSKYHIDLSNININCVDNEILKEISYLVNNQYDIKKYKL